MNARLTRPDAATVAPEVADLVSLTERHGEPPATIELLAHNPDLLGPFLGWAAAIARAGQLPARDHELLALRAAHLCQSPFEWEEHTGFGRDAGLTDAEIMAIREWPDGGEWDAREQAVLAAADELHASGCVTDATYTRLAGFYEPAALVEIPMVFGQYVMLSMLTGFFAVPARPHG